MGRLQILPGNIASMIAAGEVVQRPSSVIKELMENAVDAGADSISVVITDAGRTLIQVIDNGCGMSAEDAVLCFERHATSKIATAEDLEQIGTYGFRGEALASIGAVAEVTLRTRREQDDVGTEVVYAGSKVVSVEETAAPKGCNFAVRNLFYNTPARRKFLKSDNVETKHIVEEFTRVALTRPDVSFSLSHNGRDIYVLKAAKSLKYRILDILGSSVVGDVVDIHAKTSLIGIDGYIGKPESARKTLGNQFLFVNGRYFRSPYLHKAVMKAYEEFIGEGQTPAYFIYLEVDPHSIDVNIHPTKTEIKFEDDSLVFQILYASVKETLGKNAFGAAIDFDTEGAVRMPVLGRHSDEFRPDRAPTLDFDPSYNPFDSPSGFVPSFDAPSGGSGDKAPAKPYYDTAKYVDKDQDYGKLFESRMSVNSQVIVLQDKFILTPSKSGLMVVNIRRAWERILFEKFLAAFSENSHVSQSALFPVQVKVGVEQRLIFDENAALLSSLGFDISAFGSDTIVVNAVPEGFSCEPGKVQKMVSDLIFILSEGSASLAETMHATMAEKFAILGATTAKTPSSAFEAQKLIDLLFACENSEFTSNGRRILSLLHIDELEKKF